MTGDEHPPDAERTYPDWLEPPTDGGAARGGAQADTGGADPTQPVLWRDVEAELPPPYAPGYRAQAAPQWPAAVPPRQIGRPVTPRRPSSRSPAPAPQGTRGGGSPRAAQSPVIPLPRLRFPLSTIFLGLGLLLLWSALTQPWAITSSGAQLFIGGFGSPLLGSVGVNAGQIAVRTATGIVMVITGLSLALFVLNTAASAAGALSRGARPSGCATIIVMPLLGLVVFLLFVALLLGAGFAGLGMLSGLTLARDQGLTNVSVRQAAFGYYLWWAGLVSVFAGMVGQLGRRFR